MSGQLEGVPEALAALRDLKDTTAKNVGRRALVAPAEILASAVSAKAPRLSGNLAGSVRVDKKMSRASRRVGAVDTTVIADDPAAVPNEFGTSDMPANPFFRPAAEASEAAMLTAVIAAVKNEVGKAVARAARKAAKG